MKLFFKRAQEEMFTKVLQLHIAPNPSEIITWMFEHGVDKTLNSYGFSNKDVMILLQLVLYQYQDGHQN